MADTKRTRQQTIALHPLAPPKPAHGEPCNGCGVCCAAEPCPMAMLFLRQFSGHCRALLWQEETNRYVCGLVVCPERYVSLIPARWRERFGRWISSRIATGKGCDSTIEIEDEPH